MFVLAISPPTHSDRYATTLDHFSIQHVSSLQSPITVRDALSPRPLAPTRIDCPLVGGAKPYELEVRPVDGQVAEWRLNKE